MKIVTKNVVAAILILLLAGCVSVSKVINAKSQSLKKDVFVEVSNEGIPPEGFSHLLIQTSIKTHLVGHYLLEPEESLHGKSGYPFVINIDGQAVEWKIDGQEEITPAYNEKGRRTPEGGDGMRYILQRKIRLAAGMHKIFLGLPEDTYFKEIDIKVANKELCVLDYKPVYGEDRRVPSFLNGVSSLDASFKCSSVR